jgi:hypothetical protein
MFNPRLSAPPAVLLCAEIAKVRLWGRSKCLRRREAAPGPEFRAERSGISGGGMLVATTTQGRATRPVLERGH